MARCVSACNVKSKNKLLGDNKEYLLHFGVLPRQEKDTREISSIGN